MIKERIHRYLEAEEKTLDRDTILWAASQFAGMLRHRFADEYQKPNHLYATLLTKACARQAAYKYHLTPPDEPLEPRVRMNFLVGDIVELAMLFIAKAAGCDIKTPQERFPNKKMTVKDGSIEFGCWPDAIAEAGETIQNIEIKKMNEYVFDRMIESRELDDMWGYKTQTMLEVAAWRQQGVRCVGTLLLALRGLTGHMDELFVPYEHQLVEKAFQRARQVSKSTPIDLPGRAYRLVQLSDGRFKLDIPCAYCSFKRSCWGSLTTEFDKRNKPTFYVDRVEKLAEAILETLEPGGLF